MLFRSKRDEILFLERDDFARHGVSPLDKIEEAQHLIALVFAEGGKHLRGGFIADQAMIRAHDLRQAHADGSFRRFVIQAHRFFEGNPFGILRAMKVLPRRIRVGAKGMFRPRLVGIAAEMAIEFVSLVFAP